MRFQAKVKAMVLFLTALVATVTFAACNGSDRSAYESTSSTKGRTIQHAMGETIVPQTPERVALLWSVVDTLALGVEPVGGAIMNRPPQVADANELAPIFSKRTEDIVVLGHARQPNLERIVELQPDLILGTTATESSYPQLSQIAPTVLVDISGAVTEWKEYILEWATALGKRDEAQALIRQYEQRIAQFQAAMGDRVESIVVSVVRFSPDQIRLYQQESLSGAVLAEAGLLRPESQQGDMSEKTISLESLANLDSDVLFFMQDDPKQSVLAEVQGNPLWSQLGVVQRGQVYELSTEVWFLNPGIVSAHMMLNDLFRTLVPEGEQYVIQQIGELTLP